MRWDEYTVRVTLPFKQLTAIYVAQVIRRISSNAYSIAEALMIARALLKGEGWEPPYDVVMYGLQNLEHPFEFKTNVQEQEDRARAEREEHIAEYKRGEELAKLGAEGDISAAIAFCKLFNRGAMHVWMMG